MESRLFPNDLLPFTKEHHFVLHSRSSMLIYSLLIAFLVISILMLPFLFVDVSVRCSGVLKAASEVSVIRANSTGVVRRVFLRENMTVQKGQLLFEVSSAVLEEREQYYKNKLNEIRVFLGDLKQLTDPTFSEHFEKLNRWMPATTLYRQSISDYSAKLRDRQTRLQKVKQDYVRNKKLYDVGVIAEAEFENHTFELDKAIGELNLLRQTHISSWQQEFQQYSNELKDFQNQLNQLYREKERLNIVAPIAGTTQNLVGVYPGSHIFENQDLGLISPDTSLIAEVYVSPSDIGLLRKGMNVRMQISAFNYNQWGHVEGRIEEISNDIQTTNNQSFFKVRCSLDRDYLRLKNGYKGNLKKGMSLQARFIVVERSLWQLLYDQVDNWMNPNTD